MTRRAWLRLIAVLATLGVLVAAAVAIVGALTGALTPAPKALATDDYETLLRSGAVAGVPATLDAPPARPELDVAELSATHYDLPSCVSYWTAAKAHLVDAGSLTPADPTTSMVDAVDTELWDTVDAAAKAMTQWTTCRGDYDKTSQASSPVKVLGRGITDGVTWQYAESLDLDNPVHLLTLRRANVIANFSLPDGPPEDWRDQLARAFAAQVGEATGP